MNTIHQQIIKEIRTPKSINDPSLQRDFLLPKVDICNIGEVVALSIYNRLNNFPGDSLTVHLWSQSHVTSFRWLGLIGVNPLAYPGRTYLIPFNTSGLIGACIAMILAYWGSVSLGYARDRQSANEARLGLKLAISMVPIAFAYHTAHYLPAFLVEAQYAVRALSDPFSLGWDLFGTARMYTKESLGTHYLYIELTWYAQMAAIVIGHVAAILVAHLITLREVKADSAAGYRQIPLTVLMIAYTFLGLWLLSAPTV